MAESYVIGVDFGSDSVRALIVNTETGENVGQSVASYKKMSIRSISPCGTIIRGSFEKVG